MKSITIQLLKALAAQVIVFHHLALYGPLAKAFAIAAPTMAWYAYEYGLHAVQVFLVIGGFLAAGTLFPRIASVPLLLSAAWRRYKRLLPPFALALIIVLLISAIARQFTNDPIVPDAPHFFQVLTHLLLVQGVFQQPSLTVGVWYIGIDFQLYVLVAFFAFVANRAHRPKLFVGLVTASCFASILWFRTLSDVWSEFAVWFFFAYGLGVLVNQCTATTDNLGTKRISQVALVACSFLLYQAFMNTHDWRFIAALVTGLMLLARSVTDAWFVHLPDRLKQLIQTLGDHSFALFLMHFPVSLMVNTYLDVYGYEGAIAGALGVVLAWSGAMLLSTVFDRACISWFKA